MIEDLFTFYSSRGRALQREGKTGPKQRWKPCNILSESAFRSVSSSSTTFTHLLPSRIPSILHPPRSQCQRRTRGVSGAKNPHQKGAVPSSSTHPLRSSSSSPRKEKKYTSSVLAAPPPSSSSCCCQRLSDRRGMEGTGQLTESEPRSTLRLPPQCAGAASDR